MNPGDVVQLKSGGPLMTLDGYDSPQFDRWGNMNPTAHYMVSCSWMEETDQGIWQRKTESFRPASLKKVV